MDFKVSDIGNKRKQNSNISNQGYKPTFLTLYRNSKAILVTHIYQAADNQIKVLFPRISKN